MRSLKERISAQADHKRNIQSSRLSKEHFSPSEKELQLDKYDAIAHADTVIEIAQNRLTIRASMYNVSGILCVLFSIFIILFLLTALSAPTIFDRFSVSSAYTSNSCTQGQNGACTTPIFTGLSFADFLESIQKVAENGTKGSPSQTPSLLDGNSIYILAVIHILKLSAVTALSIGIVYKLHYLARSCFAEASGIFAKRHALRFGRLYLNLKIILKDINNDDKIQITHDELRSIFSWNIEQRSVFSNEKSELFPPAIPSQIVDAFKEAIKSKSGN